MLTNLALMIFWACVCMLLSLMSAAHAQDQLFMQGMDNVFRAAYCNGVLNNAVEYTREFTRGCTDLYRGMCADASDQLKSLEEKQRRYAEFTIAHQMSLPLELGARVSMIRRKGEADYKRRIAEWNETKRRKADACDTQCRVSLEMDDQCLVDCYAKFDETLSGIHACLFLPDKLPPF